MVPKINVVPEKDYFKDKIQKLTNKVNIFILKVVGPKVRSNSEISKGLQNELLKIGT